MVRFEGGSFDGQVLRYPFAALPEEIPGRALAAFVARGGKVFPVKLESTSLPKDWIATSEYIYERVREGHVPGEPHLYRANGSRAVYRCRALTKTGARCRNAAERNQLCKMHANSADKGAPPALIAEDHP